MNNNQEKFTNGKTLNSFMVNFLLNNIYIEEFEEEKKFALSTLFKIENEEDNILFFYYHILDIAENIIDGTLELFNLPNYKNVTFEKHDYAYHTKELLRLYKNHILDEIIKYEEFKKTLNK